MNQPDPSLAPQNSQGLNCQLRNTHGSSCICNRGWPSQSSMGGEAIGPVMVLCSSIRECLGQEAGVCGLGSIGSGGSDR